MFTYVFMLFSMSSSYTEGITKDLSNQSKLKKTLKVPLSLSSLQHHRVCGDK